MIAAAGGLDTGTPAAGRPSAAPLVEFSGIAKSFGGVHAIRDVSFELLPGEVHALLGQNGAGKSTLIKILAGVIPKDRGTIRVEGEVVDFRTPAGSRAAGIAVVYQDLSLVPSMSVADNIFLKREPSRFGIAQRGVMVREAKRFLEGHGFKIDPNAIVADLPFAYRQLTEIAKALMGKVKVLVLDEPTSSLSGGEETILFNAVAQVTAQGVGVIYVTHRLGEVFRLAQRVTVLRDGRNAWTSRTADTNIPELVSAILGPGDKESRLATVVGLGPHGETAAAPDQVRLTAEEIEAAKQRKFRIAVAFHTTGSDWSQQQLAGISDTLKKCGADLATVADSRFKPADQVEQLAAIIKSRPDAIVGIPVDIGATAQAFKQVSGAGIKLVLMDNAPNGMRAGEDYSSLVSADNFGLGQIAAKLLADHIPAKGTAALIGFGMDFFATGHREAAFRRWMADNRPDVTIVRTEFLNLSEAGQVGADFLAAHPEANGAFVVWDEPAMDIIAALQKRGKTIAMTTVDLGAAAALELARGGMIKGIAAQRPYDQGVAEAEAAIRALLGKEPPAWIALPAVSVTARNLLEAYETVWRRPPPLELAAVDGKAASHPEPRRKAPAAARQTDLKPPLVELRGVHNERLKGVDLALRPGEIAGLAGMIGSGRTDILETIFGLRRVASGELLLNGQPAVVNGPLDAIRRGIALVPEDRHVQGLVLEHSVERNIAMPRLRELGHYGMFRKAASTGRALAAIRDLSIKVSGPSIAVHTLSGGNQQKVVFGKWREPTPIVLLLDEPTVGVDVGARAQIYDVMRDAAKQGSAVLVVSSDLGELVLLCDCIAVVVDGQVRIQASRAEIKNEEQLHQMVQEAQG